MATFSNISEKALLVSVKISMWRASKKDSKITTEVHDTHQCKGDAGKYIKQLIDKKNGAYKEIQKVHSEIRAYRDSKTLPWLDDGIRVLPSGLYMDFNTEMRVLQTKFDHAVTEFEREYQQTKDLAKITLNGLYDETDYPLDVRSLFGLEIRFLPFPSQDDFRVDISTEETNLLKSQLEQDVNTSLNNMLGSLYERLRDCVWAMSVALKDTDKVFRDSLIGNLKKVCVVVSELNLTNDQHLADLASEIATTLASTTPEGLREDKDHRKEIQQKADTILAKMEGF